MRVLSVNLTELRHVRVRDKDVETSIYKRPVDHAVRVERLGLQGERRISKRMCAEEDHAVYVYPHEHYGAWCSELEVASYPYGQFGENLTTEGLHEGEVRIGDVMRFGGAVLRVRQPRLPCRKLDVRMGHRFAGRFLRSRRLGFYLAVIETGEVRAGDSVELLQRDAAAPTVDELIRLSQIDYWDAEGLSRLVACDALPVQWRQTLDDKLERARSAQGWQGLRALEVVGRDDECQQTVSLWLRCARGRPLPGFTAGQYLTLAHRDAADRLVHRPYAITSDPGDTRRYRITVRRASGPVSSLLHDTVKLGDELRMAAPGGDFTLAAPSEQEGRALFIHDELGAASVIPLLRQWSREPHAAPAFHHAVGRPAWIPLRDELERAVAAGTIESRTLSVGPRQGWPRTEQPDEAADALRAVARDARHVYVAGESGFVERVQELLSGTDATFHTERYGRIDLD